jgi:O-antigen ligase/tetratricopeptide (TPR) repeat protein
MIYRLITILLMGYLFLRGALYNGIVSSDIQITTILLMIGLVVGWLFLRSYNQWKWHHTPLDAVFLLWGLAFIVSLLMNREDWRQIVIALWYAGFYIGIWYILLDLLANQKLQRSALIDGLIVVGTVLILFSYGDLANAKPTVDGLFGLPRPSGLLGNPNLLATTLIVIMTFTIGRFISIHHRWIRLILAVITLAALLLLLLTFSRGAWIGLAMGMMVSGSLLLAHHNLLSFQALRQWWTRQSRSIQIILMVTTVIGVGLFLLTTAFVLISLTLSGRGIDNRTYLYNIGIENFLQKPISGIGLFTFGEAVELAQVQHPEYSRQIHSHAHNIVIHVAAELGLFGLVALFATIWVSIRAFRRNWRTKKERILLLTGAGGAVSFAIHHLFDVTAMLPAVALLGLVTLIIMIAPIEPEPIRQPVHRLIHRGSVGVLWALLLTSGLWNANLYGQYMNTVYSVFNTNSYLDAANALQPIVDVDPEMPTYRVQQAMFYALAANTGDRQALDIGIKAYDSLTEFMPNTAMIRANLAGLLLQSGQAEPALHAIQRAAELDPASWQFALLWGQYAEAVGNSDLALAAYTQAHMNNNHALFHPTLEASPIVSDMISTLEPGLPQVAMLYVQRRFDEAEQLWATLDEHTTASYIVRSLIALAKSDRGAALDWFEQAKQQKLDKVNEQWLIFGQQHFDEGSDISLIEQLTPPMFNADYGRGAFLMRTYFLQDMLPMAYIPQVGYSEIDPLLLYLLHYEGE